jgi:hypothetical protein
MGKGENKRVGVAELALVLMVTQSWKPCGHRTVTDRKVSQPCHFQAFKSLTQPATAPLPAFVPHLHRQQEFIRHPLSACYQQYWNTSSVRSGVTVW